MDDAGLILVFEFSDFPSDAPHLAEFEMTTRYRKTRRVFLPHTKTPLFLPPLVKSSNRLQAHRRNCHKHQQRVST